MRLRFGVLVMVAHLTKKWSGAHQAKKLDFGALARPLSFVGVYYGSSRPLGMRMEPPEPITPFHFHVGCAVPDFVFHLNRALCANGYVVTHSNGVVQLHSASAPRSTQIDHTPKTWCYTYRLFACAICTQCDLLAFVLDV